jgi:hypothetical protein
MRWPTQKDMYCDTIMLGQYIVVFHFIVINPSLFYLIKYWFVVFPPFLSDQLYVAYGYVIAVDSYLIFSKSSWVSRLTDSKIFELETDTTQMFKCIWENGLFSISTFALHNSKRISVDLIWFSIPYKLKTFTLYLFFYFWGRRHELTIKVKMGIIKAYMDV